MWRTVKLGEVCELAYGKALDKSERLDSDGVPAFGANGIKTFAKKSLFDEPSIIVGRKGSAGEITKVNEPFWALDVTYYIKIDRDIIDLNFLFYTLTTLNLPSMARGVKPGINRNDVYEKRILLPQLAEQQRIVAKLDAAFAEIDRMVKSSQLKQAEVKRLPLKLLKKILEDETCGWTSERLSSIAVNLDAQRIPITKSNRTEGNIPYYGASGIVDYVSDFIFDEELLLISEDGANLLARTYPIAFSVKGKTWVNNHAHVLKFENKMLQKWVEYYLNSTNIERFISGMAQPKLNQKKLNEIPIPCPNPNLLPKLLSNFEQIAFQSEIAFKLQTKKMSKYKNSNQ